MGSEKLHEVLYMVLVAGNFLNSGGYAGNAAGFKTMSLLKLTDIRANKPGMNLVHYVAVEAEKKESELLNFTEEMVNLEEAAKLSIDNLKSEATNLSQRVSKISQQVVSAEEEIKEQMEDFLKFAERGVACIMKDIENLNIVRKELADFLCEDFETFKLEDCFKVFQSFCQKFKMAVQDNERRRQQEKRAQERRRQKEEQDLLKRRSYSGLDVKDSPGSDHIVDMLLGDIRSGFPRMGDNYRSRRGRGGDVSRMNSQTGSLPSEDECMGSPRMLRRRIGSLGSIPANGEVPDTDSPDTTPNGSMRRRRSRLSSDEQEDPLLDFLRQGSELEARDRRSWGSYDGGSLDRSWLRRSGRRRRQDLLSADLNDRERPASPLSPMMDKCAELPEPEPKVRPWRSKIEDWLTENEKEQEKERKLRERMNAERKRRQELELKEIENSLRLEREGLETLHEARADEEHKLGKANKNTNCQDEMVKAVPMRDKSKWRKSNLNVANSSECSDTNSSNHDISFYIQRPSVNNQSSASVPDVIEMSDQGCQGESFNGQCKPGKIVTENAARIVTNTTTEPTVTVNGLWYPEISEHNSILNSDVAHSTPVTPVRGSRKYHSLREPSWRIREEKGSSNVPSYKDSVKERLTENAVTPNEGVDMQNSFIQEKCNDKHLKNITDNLEEETDALLQFERFSPMRRTTRRPRNKEQEYPQKDTQLEPLHDKFEKNKRNWPTIGGVNQTLPKINDAKNSELDYIEGAIENISKASREIQELDKINRAENSCDKFEGKRQLVTPKSQISKRLHSLADSLDSEKEAELPFPNVCHPIVNGENVLSNSSNNRQKNKFVDTVPSERVFRSTLELTPTSPTCENRTLLPVQQNGYSKKHYVESPLIKPNRLHSGADFDSQINKDSSLPAENKEDNRSAKTVSSLEIPTKIGSSHIVALKQRTSDEPDEGFEETQSQLSETASQAPSGAFDTDLADGSPRIQREKKSLPDVIAGTNTVTVNSPQINGTKEPKPSSIPQIRQTPKRPSSLGIPVLNRSLSVTDRSRRPNFSRTTLRSTSMEKSQPSMGPFSRRQRGLLYRTVSTDSQNSAQGLGKRSRSGSRTSLRGSNSSIGSGTSRSRNGGTGSKDSARRIAAYTDDLRNRTRNLRKRGLERFEATQSVPSTPSEESKHITPSSRSGSKYSPSGSKTPSRASSIRSLSRRSSDGSITASRQDLLKKAIRSSPTAGTRPISSLRKPNLNSRMTKMEPVMTSRRALSRAEPQSNSPSNRLELKSCNFMRATSSSTAKSSLGKTPDSSVATQRLRTKPSSGQSPVRTWPVTNTNRLSRN